MNVKLNDNVLVIVGKDKGKQGKVIATSPKANTVTVECDKATRVKHGVADGKKVRVCAKCGATLDKAYSKKSAKAAAAAETEAPKKRTRKRAAKPAEPKAPETPATTETTPAENE